MFAGTFILFDFPQAFEKVLIEKFEVSAVSVVSLYSINASTTLIMDLAMIWILEKISLGKAAVLFQALCCLGVLFTHVGVSSSSFTHVVVGRLFFGIGNECLYVVNNIAVEKWFDGTDMLIVCGLARIQLRLCTWADAFLFPIIFMSFGESLSAVMYAVEAVTLVTVLMTLIFYWIDEKYDRINAEQTTQKCGSNDQEVELESQLFETDSKVETKASEKRKRRRMSAETEATVLSAEAFNEFLSTEGQEGEETSRNGSKTNHFGLQEAVFELKHLLVVPKISWVMITFAMMSVCCYYQLTNMATDLITVRFNYEYLDAKNAAATIPFLNLFMITTFIYLVTKYGGKTYCYISGSVCYLLCFTSLLLLPSSKPSAWKVYLSLSALACGNALILSSMTAGILLTIPTKSSRFVIPIMAVGYNLPGVLSSPVMGIISQDCTVQAYQNCLYLLLAYGFVCLGLSLYIRQLNKQDSVRGLLDRPGNDSWATEYKARLNEKIDVLILTEKKVEKIDISSASDDLVESFELTEI